MKRIKDTLGIFGYILYYLISFFITFMPLYLFDFNFITIGIITAIVLFIPIVSDITLFALWIFSFLKILPLEFDWFTICYLIALAIYLITEIIPFIISVIGAVAEKIYYR